MIENKRYQTPLVLQMEAQECGAAALAIILGFYGSFIPLLELRNECGVSRDGSRANNMLKTARKYGLNTDAFQVKDWEAAFNLKLPSILFWEFNHFVVLEGIDTNKKLIYINDPAIGHKTLSEEEFSRGFTGIVLTFEPNPLFKKTGKSFSLINEIKQRLMPFKSVLWYIFFVSLLLVIPNLLLTGFIKIFIDDVLINSTRQWIPLLILGILLTSLFRGFLYWLQQITTLKLQTNIFLQNSFSFMWYLLRLPYQFFSQRFAGDIIERIAANQTIAEILSTNVTVSLFNLFSMLIYAIFMALLSPPLTLIAIILAMINAYFLIHLSTKIANIEYRYIQEAAKLGAIEINGLQIIESLKISDATTKFFRQWAGIHAKTINSQQMGDLYAAWLDILPNLFLLLATVLFLGIGCYFIINSQLTIGSLVALQSLFISFSEPLRTLLSSGSELPKVKGEIIRLDDVLKNPLDIRFTKKDIPDLNHDLTENLKLDHISYGYSPLDPPIIENLSLDIQSNTQTAIIGETGSGKSTLLKLILGIYQPWKGEIRYGNQHILDYPRDKLAKIFALADQDILLFNGTIRENLCFWDDTIPDDILEEALILVHMNHVLSNREGLNTCVLENGVNFSGGERQRLELARALILNPKILILDEATSALDLNLEKAILSNIKKRKGTTIMITHRVHSIIDCDQIIVMEKGKIVQSGKHDFLIQQPGKYQSLYGKASN